MVAIKNPTFIGKGPAIPTTAVPSYKANDPYYPKGTIAEDPDPEPDPAPEADPEPELFPEPKAAKPAAAKKDDF